MWHIDANVAYRCPTGAYPLRDFHKICTVCTSFQDVLAAKKFHCICSRGYGVMGVLSWGDPATPKFSAPHGSKTMHQTPKSFRGTRMYSRSSITMTSLVGRRFHQPPGRPKTLGFLFVCWPDCKPEWSYFQPSLSVCLCVYDWHFYPSTLTDFDETWSQGPYCDIVWPRP